MSEKSIAVLLALIGITACGGSAAPQTPTGPTTASVAAQPADLPSGMVRCDLSGDVNKYISAEEGTDPKTARATRAEWEDAQKAGASAAYATFFSDSAAQCAALRSPSTDISATTHPLVLNFVIQFKDEKSAEQGYKSDKKIFGFSTAQLRNSPQPVLEGSKTGLTSNSIVLTTRLSDQTFYIAMWQNKTFMVFLAIVNMDQAASSKVAASENSRIK